MYFCILFCRQANGWGSPSYLLSGQKKKQHLMYKLSSYEKNHE